jgi:hypothetical protein
MQSVYVLKDSGLKQDSLQILHKTVRILYHKDHLTGQKRKIALLSFFIFAETRVQPVYQPGHLNDPSGSK